MSEQLGDICHTLVLNAPLAKVSRALNTPELVIQWLGCMAYSGRVGETFYMQPDEAKRMQGSIEGATHCELLELSQTTMSFSWFFPDTPKTTVTLSLTPQGEDETLVRLVHSGWEQFPKEAIEQVWEALKSGWGSGVLPKLSAIVETDS